MTQEAEKLYLHSLFSSERLTDQMRVAPEEIEYPPYRSILECIYVTDEAHGIHDQATVSAQMRDESNIHAKVCEDLAADPQMVGGATQRAQMIRRAALHRRYRDLAKRAADAFSKQDEATGLQLVDEIINARPVDLQYPVMDMGEAIEIAIRETERFQTGKSKRVRFGLGPLDDAIGGLVPGSMTTVGGRTSAGKSSMIQKAAMNMAAEGVRVGILSLEDPADLWGSRTLASIAGIPLSILFTGAGLDQIALDELRTLADHARKTASGYSIRLCLGVGATADESMREAEKLVNQYAPDVLFVDYLQAARFDLGIKRHDKAVSDFAARLKGLCNRARIPLVVTSQLKRSEGGVIREPGVSDLKETGDLENASEVVILLWQESDKPGAATLGKIGKIKWARSGKRFRLDRSATHGMVTGVSEI